MGAQHNWALVQGSLAMLIMNDVLITGGNLCFDVEDYV